MDQRSIHATLSAASRLGFVVEKEGQLEVFQSANGFFIGSRSADGVLNRESACFYPSKDLAQEALNQGSWPMREGGLQAQLLASVGLSCN